MDWAISWVLLKVGRPVPTSRNCLMPTSPVRYLTARPMNARVARAMTAMSGKVARNWSPAARSTA